MRQGRLIRKQYLVTEENIRKLDKIAVEQGVSATEIVRQAIEAYDPYGADLMELVSTKLKEATAVTKNTNRKVAKALNSLDRLKT